MKPDLRSRLTNEMNVVCAVIKRRITHKATTLMRCKNVNWETYLLSPPGGNGASKTVGITS